MSAFNPIASMQRAEALADELRDAMSELVTREFFKAVLKAEMDRQFIRLCAAGAAMLTPSRS